MIFESNWEDGCSWVREKFARPGYTQEKIDNLFWQLQKPMVVNLDPHPLSIAIAAIIFNVYSR